MHSEMPYFLYLKTHKIFISFHAIALFFPKLIIRKKDTTIIYYIFSCLKLFQKQIHIVLLNVKARSTNLALLMIANGLNGIFKFCFTEVIRKICLLAFPFGTKIKFVIHLLEKSKLMTALLVKPKNLLKNCNSSILAFK